MSALCVNCLAWHGSNTDNTLCGDFVALPTVAHEALAALPAERPEWFDGDVWIAGFYAGFRAARQASGCRGCLDTGRVYESQNDVFAFCTCPAGQALAPKNCSQGGER